MTCLGYFDRQLQSTMTSKAVNLSNTWRTICQQKSEGFQKFWVGAGALIQC